MTIAIDPVVFAAGALQVRWSAVFVAIAVVVGLVVARRWSEAVALKPVALTLGAALVIVAGVVVGRAAVLIERPDLLRRGIGFAAVLAQGGISVPAAALGGAGAVVAWAALTRRSLRRAVAAAAGGLLVGEAVASVGLLLSGDYTGAATEGPWAVAYTRPDAGVPATLLGRPVHPLALYSLVWMGAAAAWIWQAWPARTMTDRWSLAALAFGLGHLVIGYGRIDPVWLLGLRADQLFGLVWVAIGGVGLVVGERRVVRPAIAPTREPMT